MRQKIQFLFAFTLLFFVVRPLPAQWTTQGAGLFQAETWVEVLRPVNADVVWATIDHYQVYLGNDSTWLPRIIHTTDGGQTWKQDSIADTNGYLALGLSALSADTAWVTLYNPRKPTKNRLYRTTDSGTSWQQKYQEDSIAGLGVHFFDAQHGLIFRGSSVRVTQDGGITWQPPIDLPVAVNKNIFNYGGDAYATLQNNLWLPLADGNLLKTTDRGNHWTLHSTPLVGDSVSFNCIAFSDANHGLALGIFTTATYSGVVPNRLFRTEDGGTNWTEVPPANLPVEGWYGAVEAIPGSPNTFIMFGVDFGTGTTYDYVTHDVGLSWQNIGNIPAETRQIYGFVSPTVGWSGSGYLAVPFSGIISKWNGGPLVEAFEPNETAFVWEQFPNPAHDWLQFCFPADITPADMEIALYDNEHHLLFSGPAATSVNVQKLPVGIYYTVMRRGQKVMGMKPWVKVN